MEPNNQSDNADIEGYHQEIAELVGDASTPPPLNPQQELAAPVERSPPRMPQSPPKEVAPTATPDMLEPQPKAPSYGRVELSPGDSIRGGTLAWLSDTAPAAPDTSAAPTGSELSASAEEYHPIAPSQSHPSVLQSSSTRSFSASQGQTSASGPRSLTPEEDEALRCFRGLVTGDVSSARSSACLVRLLKEGLEVVRKGVLDVVKRGWHFVMASPEWHDVFVELLRKGSFDELRVIVDVTCKSDFSLLSVAGPDNEFGVKSLTELIKAVAQHPLLRQDLVNCLVNDRRLFRHSRSPDLLRSMFTTFSADDSSVIIDRALGTFRGFFSSKFESDSMVECFAVAQGAELQRFERLILSKTVEFARGLISNHFLQGVLERGSEQLKVNITQRVLDNLVALSMDKHGCFVVQACFVRTGLVRPQLLERMIAGFQGLPLEDLDQLVRDIFAANQVVSKLLLEGKEHCLAETKALAQTIQTLPAAGMDPTDLFVSATVGRVMEAVSAVLSYQPLHYPVLFCP